MLQMPKMLLEGMMESPCPLCLQPAQIDVAELLKHKCCVDRPEKGEDTMDLLPLMPLKYLPTACLSNTVQIEDQRTERKVFFLCVIELCQRMETVFKTCGGVPECMQ